MDPILFDKLNQPIEDFISEPPLQKVLRAGKIFHMIDIYLKQQQWGGYASPDIRPAQGLRKLKHLGKIRQIKLEKILAELNFPPLPDAPRVISDFHEWEKKLEGEPHSSVNEGHSRQLITDLLTYIGRKHDPETIRRVLEITNL